MNKIGFTTSRSPAKKTRSFVLDILQVVPHSFRFVRGSSNLNYCLNSMKNQNFKTAIIINSVKGNPNFIRIFDLTENAKEIPFAIKIRGLTISREYQNEKRKSKPNYSFLISSLNNIDEEAVIRRFLGITNEKVDEIEEKEYVTTYADYIDKDEGLIFIEFLDRRNKQVGPRLKMKIVTRQV